MKTKAFLILGSLILLSACGVNKTPPVTKVAPTPPTSAFEFKSDEKPLTSLTPRSDGHQLTLKIDKIPSSISQIEYELIYTASDNGMDIEKGLGDTIKLNGESTISRDLLLGTASCTNGCKYKYDNGVSYGTVTLTFMTANNQVTTYTGPFTLKNGAEIRKTGSLVLKEDNFTIRAKPISSTEYFILLRNYQNGYNVFSSDTGKGTVTELSPSTFTKSDKTTITGL